MTVVLFSSLMIAQKKVESNAENMPNHFRNVRWGMTKAQVKTLETTHFDEDKGNTLVYLDNIVGFETEIVYTFYDGKLCQGVYHFVLDSFTDYNKYIENFDKIKSLLIKKYNFPKEDGVNWIGTQGALQDKALWSEALYKGQIAFDTYWYTDATEIHLSMRSIDHKIVMSLNYETINLKADLEKLKLKSELQGL